MFILSDVYRLLIGIGDRALSPSMKRIVKWDHPGSFRCTEQKEYSIDLVHFSAGPKYVHFWSRKCRWTGGDDWIFISKVSLAVMKSSLVVAGLGDLMRPAEKLSLNQSISLAATGLIWSRVWILLLSFGLRIDLFSTAWWLSQRIIFLVLSILLWV